MSTTKIEREAVVLRLTIEVINSMVNHEMLNFGGEPEITQATFKSPTRRSLFCVLLADMLEQVDRDLVGIRGSLLDALGTVSSDPQLPGDEAREVLAASVANLTAWLDTEITVKAWFPSLDEEVPLSLRRRDFVAICGNLSKHNPARLTRNAKRLRKLLEASGVSASLIDSLRALDDFYERFHVDILSYHSTSLAEMLTEVRWAIHEYLAPEFYRAYVPPPSVNDPRYSFTYPPELENEYAKVCYWDLMNSVRSGPYIDRFTGTRYLKMDY